MADKPLDIAVGVLVDRQDRVLIARRRPDTPGAGFWEFPGGKREAGETMTDCLSRELAEEIGVTDLAAEPLIRFTHRRGPRPVCLHVARITHWTGAPAGREGQEIAWHPRAELSDVTLLPATEVILAALALPPTYLITPAMGRGRDARHSWFEALERLLRMHRSDNARPMIRLRQPQLDDDDYEALARSVRGAIQPHRACLVLDRGPALVERLGAQGLHISGRRLARLDERPLSREFWVGASAHDRAGLAKAADLGLDFATLSPVVRTQSHPEARPLGWPGFEDRRDAHAIPVYALGGMTPGDLATARDHFAQGVAGIRGFWPGS